MPFSETVWTVFSHSTGDQKPDCSRLQHSEGEKDQATTQWGWKGPGYNTVRGKRTRLQHSEGEKDQATTQWGGKGPSYNTVRGRRTRLQLSEGEKDQATTQWGEKGPSYNTVRGKRTRLQQSDGEKDQATKQWGRKGPSYNTVMGKRTRLQYSEGETDQATTQWWEKGPGYNTVRGGKDRATTQWGGKRTVNARATLKHRPITFSKTFSNILLSLFSSAVMTTTQALLRVVATQWNRSWQAACSPTLSYFSFKSLSLSVRWVLRVQFFGWVEKLNATGMCMYVKVDPKQICKFAWSHTKYADINTFVHRFHRVVLSVFMQQKYFFLLSLSSSRTSHSGLFSVAIKSRKKIVLWCHIFGWHTSDIFMTSLTSSNWQCSNLCFCDS